MERVTQKDERGYYLVGDGIYSDWGVPEKFRGDDVDRLAAYEDTGLEPEEIEKAMDIVKSAVSAFEDFGVDRLAELAEADREGRCVVLPCKIGDPVWRLYDDCDFPGDCYTKQKCRGCEYRNLFIEEQAFCLSMLCQNGKLSPPYYTTRAEAEAELQRGQE